MTLFQDGHAANKPPFRITQRARVSQVFWCDFSKDAPAEEFHGEHPAVVIRQGSGLYEPCIVVPLTSKFHAPAPTIHKLRRNYNPALPALDVWAICHHLYTVSQRRFRPFVIKGKQHFPRMQKDDFADVVSCIRRAMPWLEPQIAKQGHDPIG